MPAVERISLRDFDILEQSLRGLGVDLGVVSRPAHHLDQSTPIKGLYPATEVSSNLICTIVNSLGQGEKKPSSTTQNLLLGWLILVYEFVEDPTILFKLYNVLFNLLDMISIRGNLCHLISLITQKKHVKLFRIQMLLELSRRFDSEPALLALLKVYQEYYPDVVVGNFVTGRLWQVQYPNAERQERLRAIQNTGLRSSRTSQSNAGSFKVCRRGLKRNQTTVVPEVQTFRSDESSTTIEEIEGVSDFIQKLDKITLPNQLVSALEDPLLRIYLILRNDDLPNHRIDDWLSLFFDAQVQIEQSREKPSKTLVEILGKSLSYAHHAKVLPTPVQTFLGIFLENWNGKHHLDLILGLLAYLNMNSYQELQGSILQKLELALLDDSVESGAALLKYYTSLTKQWTAILLSLPDPHPQNLAGVNSSLALLTDRASLLSLSLLVTYTPTQTTISTILNYHETLAFAISHAVTQPSIRILTPFSEIVYLLIFHNPTLATLSRLCSILAIYKRTFEAAMSKGSAGAIHEYPRDYVNHFNGFLMDICNLLWRSRAFNTSDTNALGCLISPAMWPSLHTYLDALMPPHVLATTFSLSHNISLSALSTSSFRSLEDRAVAEGNLLRTRHAGPVTQKSLEALAIDGGIRFGWADYRLEVLNWLGDRGVGGVGELMFCTMKHLMGMKPAGVR